MANRLRDGRLIFGFQLLLLLCAVVTVVSGSPGMAAEPETVSAAAPKTSETAQGTGDEWEFSVVPFMWFISVSGDTTIRGRTASVDASFGDIWDKLNFGLMGLLQMRKGRIGSYADIIWARLQSENGFAKGGTSNSDSTLVIADVVGFYRLGAFGLGSGARAWAPKVTLDPYVGFRSWTVRASLNIRTKFLPTVSVDQHLVWFDAIAGVRTIWDFTESWNAILKADAGGGSSDVTAQGLLTFGYRFDMFGKKNANVQLGYRVLYVNYSTSSGNDPNNFRLNATLHGPILRIGFTF